MRLCVLGCVVACLFAFSFVLITVSFASLSALCATQKGELPQSIMAFLTRSRVFNVTQDGSVRGLDVDDGPSSSSSSFLSSPSSSSSAASLYASGAPVSSRFSAVATPGDNFGHYRITSPPIEQAERTFANSTLQTLSPYKVRDLFQSQAARAMISRKDVLKQTQKELYVPRTAKLLKSEDFCEFNAAANAYAATMANTTANARAKAAARAASLASGGTLGNAGSGGGAAATVAAATASALAASANGTGSTAPLHLPIIPDSIDAFELGKAAATEAYLQDIWNENRNKEASDERLKKHIKKLVHEWSSKLARFEEEVQRRQEDTHYARFRREQKNPLSKSLNLDEHKEKESPRSAVMRAHRSFAEDHLHHHRREAFTTVSLGKTDSQDQWHMATDLALVDTKANKVNKDALKKKKQLLDHQMSHSICASTLAAPKPPTSLEQLLASAQQLPTQAMSSTTNLAGINSIAVSDPSIERTHITLSAFRPTTTPATRAAGYAANGGADSTDRPTSQPAGKLPSLLHSLTAPPGLSVRQTRPPPFHGEPGHGHPLNAQPVKPHIFADESIAQAAGITKPESRPTDTHIRRRVDLLEVDDIKQRLAAESINVPRGTLERALVPPEIRFTPEQQTYQLPTPFYALPSNPFEGQAKGKKKGKKGKEGKKGKKEK